MSTTSILYTIGQKTKAELDKKLDLAGGTMTGALTLSGAPSSDLHAATKAYVDSEITSTGSDVTSLQSALNTEISDRQSGDSALSSRLDTLEADPTTQTLLDNTSAALNSADSALSGRLDTLEADPTTATALSTESTARANADSALSGRLDTLEADPTTQTLLTAEETARTNADTALSGRLDTLEADPTTQTLLTAEETARTNADSALDTRVSALEADSTTATALAALQADVDQNEADSDAAEIALQNRATALETQAGSIAADGNSANFSGSLAAGAITGSSLAISGNLTVSGTTTTIDTVNVDVADSIMNLSKGASEAANASNDGGFIVERGTSENNVALIWDEGIDMFQVLSTSATAAATDISGTDASASLASFNGDLYQNGTSVGSVSDFESGLTGGASGSGS